MNGGCDAYGKDNIKTNGFPYCNQLWTVCDFLSFFFLLVGTVVCVVVLNWLRSYFANFKEFHPESHNTQTKLNKHKDVHVHSSTTVQVELSLSDWVCVM